MSSLINFGRTHTSRFYPFKNYQYSIVRFINIPKIRSMTHHKHYSKINPLCLILPQIHSHTTIRKFSTQPTQTSSLVTSLWNGIKALIGATFTPHRSELKLSLEHDWWLIASYTNNYCHKIISTKIDPELGDIARSIVGLAINLADSDRIGTLHCTLIDKLFNSQFNDLDHSWKIRLEQLIKEKVIISKSLIEPVGYDVAIYNINLILQKVYSQQFKLAKETGNYQSQPYILPF